MVRCKNGIKVNGIKPEILLAIVIAEGIYGYYGHVCMLTEVFATKGHSRASLHYVGAAVDLRTNGIDAAIVKKIIADLKSYLSDEYDVVEHVDSHIHIEFQPKAQA